MSLDNKINILKPQTFQTLNTFTTTTNLYYTPLKKQFITNNNIQKTTNQTKPNLTQSIKTTPNKKTITITLQNTKFTNNSPITSKNIIYTIQQTIDKPNYIKTLTPFLKLTNSNQINTKNPKTIKLTITQINPLLKKFLTFQIFNTIQKKITKTHKTTNNP